MALRVMQAITMIAMFGITYVVFRALGPPRPTLIYTKGDKDKWDSLISTHIGSWFTATNIVGTLTLFSTVYLFFIGSSKLFGAWIFICALTIWIGAAVTNHITTSVCKIPRVEQLLSSHDQTAGVIASLFWGPDPRSQAVARLAKWLSLLNIISVLWLDFALFADLSGTLVGTGSMTWKLLILLIATFVICHFTLKYGLRGFVFADLFQAPIVLVGCAILFGGCVYLYWQGAWHSSLSQFLQPSLTTKECLLFAAHVTFLNSLYVVVTEPHWLRVWVFRQKETTLQVKSVGATAGIWLLLMVIGLFASMTTGGQVGEAAVVGLLRKLGNVSPVFFVAFWIGGVAALFSSADAQIYSLLVVREFDTTEGKLRTRLMSSIRPGLVAACASVAFAAVYALVRMLGLPFEKVIFVITPLSLNILPALLLIAKGLTPRPIYIYVSVVGYAACSVIGFRSSDSAFAWTLSAALIPVLVSAGGLIGEQFFFSRRDNGKTQT